MSGSGVPIEAVERYGRFFEVVTPDDLDALDGLCAPEIVFRDPFNDLTGIAAFRRVFEHMYEVMTNPRFEILDTAVSGRTAYYKWRFTGRTKSGAIEIDLVGMTETVFDAEGRVVAHIDHWDAAGQLHGRLPVIGGLFRWFNRKFAVPVG